MTYKNYCNRRTAKKGQKAEESQCCPLRIPIIGPILFSLFIFSPFILPTSDVDESPELVSNSIVEEPFPPNDDAPPMLEIADN